MAKQFLKLYCNWPVTLYLLAALFFTCALVFANEQLQEQLQPIKDYIFRLRDPSSNYSEFEKILSAQGYEAEAQVPQDSGLYVPMDNEQNYSFKEAFWSSVMNRNIEAKIKLKAYESFQEPNASSNYIAEEIKFLNKEIANSDKAISAFKKSTSNDEFTNLIEKMKFPTEMKVTITQKGLGLSSRDNRKDLNTIRQQGLLKDDPLRKILGGLLYDVPTLKRKTLEEILQTHVQGSLIKTDNKDINKETLCTLTALESSKEMIKSVKKGGVYHSAIESTDTKCSLVRVSFSYEQPCMENTSKNNSNSKKRCIKSKDFKRILIKGQIKDNENKIKEFNQVEFDEVLRSWNILTDKNLKKKPSTPLKTQKQSIAS